MILAPVAVAAGQSLPSCHGAGARIVGVTRQDAAARSGAAPDIVTEPSYKVAKTVVVLATGPVLGSMDSPDLKVSLACGPSGVQVSAEIERSKDYEGSAAKNVLWRPRIEIELHLNRPSATILVEWSMRLTDGSAVRRTPAAGEGPAQIFPILVSKKILL